MEKVTFRTLCLSLLLLSSTAFSQSGNNINGQVRYHDNFPISGVTAYLHNSIGEIISTTITTNGGHYTFHDVTPGNYNITFSTDQPGGGVTLTDAFIVMLHLYDLYPFTTIEELASDVDGSGTITWLDYSLILLNLNEGEPFPVGPWVFENQPVTMPNDSREGFTTRGGSSGDVNGSLVPDPKISSIFLSSPTLNSTAGPSHPIKFELTSAGNFEIEGLHLVLKIPDGIRVLSVESPVSSASISIQSDQVRVTWLDKTQQTFEIKNGMPLLVISAEPTTSSRDESSYSLKLSDESHFIDAYGELISGVNLILPTINMNVIKNMAVTVYPNPFMEYAMINYQLPGDGNVIISLFDQAGRQVREIANGDASAGNNQVKIDGSDLMPGIYHYSIMYSGSDQLITTGTIIKSK